MTEFRNGTPASAVRFGNRLAPSVVRHLTGQKGFRAAPTHKAVGRVFFMTCVRVHSHRLYAISDVPEDISEGVPLRAKGFPKRRC